MRISYILVMLSTIGYIKNDCLAGCLKCDEDDQCLFCDYTQFYKLVGISCIKFTQANCLSPDQQGICLICSPGYYVSKDDGSCIKLDQPDPESHCKIYSSQSTCEQCEQDYYVLNGVCKKLVTPIPNCSIANNEDPLKCQLCSTGYIVNYNDTECIKVQVVNNCEAYSTALCTKCKSGYYLNTNYYLLYLFDIITIPSKYTLQKQLMAQKKDILYMGSFKICQKVTVDNCNKFASFDVCEECQEGYFLTASKKCWAYPTPQINYCLKYKTSTKCLQCQSSYYLNPDSLCSPFPSTITGCSFFQSDNGSPLCTACTKQYYLNSDNKCIERTTSIQVTYCQDYQPDADICLKCETGRQITSDGLLCLKYIPSCLTYKSSSKQSEEHECEKCIQNYYIDTGKEKIEACVKGSVDNCLIYETSSNSCKTCENQYLLSNGQCTNLSTEVQNCKTYDQLISGLCLICLENYFPIKPQKVCMKANYIVQCKEMLNEDTCKICNDGYFVNDKECSPITTPENCLQRSSTTTCIKCKQNFFLNSLQLCVPPFQFFYEFCLSFPSDGLTPLSAQFCNYCKNNALPLSYKNAFVCAKQSLITGLDLSNCSQFQFSGPSSVKCAKCSTGYYLVDNSQQITCEQQCPTDTLPLIQAISYYKDPPSNSSFNKVKLGTSYSCTDNTLYTGCSHIFPEAYAFDDQDGTSKYVCRFCLSGYLRILKKDSLTAFKGTTAPFSIKGPLQVHPAISCLLSNSVITNCDYYIIVNSLPVCYKCTYGYTGAITNIDGQDEGSILSCTQMVECGDTQGQNDNGYIRLPLDKNTFHTSLGSLYSCHKCKESQQLPFLAIDFNDNTRIPKLRAYSFTGDGQKMSGGSGAKHTLCQTPSDSSFVLANPSKIDIVTNCSLGIINVNNALSDGNNDNKAIYCYACLPGFKPTRPILQASTPGRVTLCTKIDNCSGTDWMNYCSQCQAGYAYKYDKTNAIVLFDVCVFMNDPNCYAALIEDQKTTCQYCKSGFIKNIDGLCLSYTAVNCQDIAFDFFRAFDPLDSPLANFLLPLGYGCNSCNTGYRAIELTDASLINNDYFGPQTLFCTQSLYLSQKSWVQSTKLNPNCANYGTDTLGVISCKVCQSGYIISSTGNCHISTALSNCTLSQTDTICLQCETPLLIVNGKCEQPGIENCEGYSQTTNSTKQTCSKCAKGYYLEGNLCKKGDITNCLSYLSSTECQSCKDSFVLLTTSESKSYCFPVLESFNCLQIDSQNFTQNIIQCSTCKQDYVLTSSKDYYPTSICAPFTPIPLCEKYSVTQYIATSQFSCVKCQEGYYATNGICKKRSVKPFECKIFEDMTDKCKECVEGYFVSEDMLTCIAYPIGINNCITYKSITECQKCKKDMYFTSGFCKDVPLNNKVSNCEFYIDDAKCLQCLDGYFLSENACKKVQALDCLSVASITECGTCAIGYGLKLENGLKSCVAISDKNCVVYDINYPFNCQSCQTGFFAQDGLCKTITQEVPNCQIYQSADTCRQCQDGYVLSADTKTCNNTNNYILPFDNNCSTMFVKTIPVCLKCQKGFFFKGTICTPCTQNAVSDGCHNCNPNDQSKCLFCMTNYFQKADGKCYKMDTNNDDKNTTTNNDTTTTTTDNSNTDNTTTNNNSTTTDTGDNTDTTNSHLSILAGFYTLLLLSFLIIY